jgi:hypothetical protein
MGASTWPIRDCTRGPKEHNGDGYHLNHWNKLIESDTESTFESDLICSQYRKHTISITTHTLESLGFSVKHNNNSFWARYPHKVHAQRQGQTCDHLDYRRVRMGRLRSPTGMSTLVSPALADPISSPMDAGVLVPSLQPLLIREMSNYFLIDSTQYGTNCDELHLRFKITRQFHL